MQATGTQAVIPKARGIYAKRISPPEYEELVRRRTVLEVAVLLKRHPYFKSSLATLSATDPHRGQIEELLSMDIFLKYESLLRYDTSGGRFSGYYLEECELKEILKVLHLLSIGIRGAYLAQIPPWLVGKTDIDLYALAQAKDYEGVLDVLRHTPYYKVMHAQYLADPMLRDFPMLEARLLRFHYEGIMARVDRCFSGRERQAVQELFFHKAENYNLELIFRVKTYFANAYTPEEIGGLLLPYRYRVPRQRMEAMVQAPGIEALAAQYRAIPALGAEGIVDMDSISTANGWALYRHAQRLLHLTPSPAAAFAAFLTLAELERENVVNVIEGVRYNLPPEKIRSLLHF